MSVESLLALCLGFAVALLLAIPVMRMVWWRAVRLTREELVTIRPTNLLEAEGVTALTQARAAVEIERARILADKARDTETRQRLASDAMRVALEGAEARTGELLQDLSQTQDRLDQAQARIHALEGVERHLREALASQDENNAELMAKLGDRDSALHDVRTQLREVSLKAQTLEANRQRLEAELQAYETLMRGEERGTEEPSWDADNTDPASEVASVSSEDAQAADDAKTIALLRARIRQLTDERAEIEARKVEAEAETARFALMLDQSANDKSSTPQGDGHDATREDVIAAVNALAADMAARSWQKDGDDSPVAKALGRKRRGLAGTIRKAKADLDS